MSRKIILAITLLLLSSILIACSADTERRGLKHGKNSKLQVVVSFNPMREFAEAVGKDKIEIKTVVPEGTEAHDFELKPRDLENISNCDVFIYNGLGMEKWVDDALESVGGRNLNVVKASKGADLIKIDGEYDPHVWLSLKEAKNSSKNIMDAFVRSDPANKNFYESNYREFSSELDSLYNEYKSKFNSITNKKFVTGHAAFAYLCRDFGLTQNSVEDVFAEGEPTAKKLKDLVDYSRKNKIKIIFMEQMASPKVSQTLASEVGARVEEIYTIESSEDNKDYIESMKENLEKIFNSLK